MSSSDALLAEQANVLEQIVRGAPLGDVLAALCRIVERHAEDGPVRAAISLVDDDGRRLWTGAAPSLPEDYNRAIDGLAIARDVGTCCAAAARCEVVVTPDLAADPAWASLRRLPLAHGLVAAWSMPILSSTGHVLGTFGSYFTTRREPRPHERGLVEVMARTAALAIERARADRTLHEQARRQQFLADLGAATQALTEPTEVMQTSARMLAEHLDVDRCAYAPVDDERVFRITGDYTRGGVPSIVGDWDVAAFGAGCVAAMRAGEPYVVDDTDADPRIGPDDLPAYRATTIRAVVCVPLHKHGRFTAAMAVHRKTPRRWTAEEIELVTIVVARCWEALERTRVTRDLRDSEARYRTMVEATPECVTLVAGDGTLLQMNPAGLRMIDVDDERAVIGSCVYDVIAPEHRERFRQFTEQVCRGQGGALEYEIVGRTGARRAMETHAVALAAPGGGLHKLAITRDVSARVAATLALAESRARLDYAVRLSGVGFWYCDLPFDELEWDDNVKRQFFLPLDARVTLDTFYDRIHPDDREPTRIAIAASIDDQASYDVIYRTCDPSSDAIKWIRALGGTTYAGDGTPIRFDGVTVDVTAQKLEEVRVARLAEAALAIHSASTLEGVLQVVTAQARTLIGAHHAVTSSTAGDDPARSIHSVSLSDQYARFRGVDAGPGGAAIAALVGRSNRPLRLTRAELDAQLASHGASGPAEHPPLRGWLAVPFVARTGENLGLVQLSDKYDGEFTAADEAVLVQLAQLASVAIENARLYDQLREQDRRKDEFLATLAHELRNPLAPIRTGIQVLERGADQPGQAPRLLAMMDRQLGHLVHMVDDLLDISRVTLGKVSLKRQRIDLRAALDSALETARPLVEARGHELAVRLPSDELPLDVDPTRLSQVFANLINNAAKYTPPGGRILVAAEAQGDTLEVRVSDTGIGIPADMLPRVFDMFTQVGRSIDRSQGGLGIGLTLVRRIIEMHGGSADAESPGVGRGSTFIIRLPLAVRDAEPGRGPTPRPMPAATAPALRILVVDDNVDAAETLAMLLELGGNLTRLAHSGPAALEQVTDFRPDLVFLDIGLPEMNGYEVAARVRADPAIPQPVLVALTGWGSEDDRRQAHAAGFDRHLVKPIDGAKLEAVLAALRS
ncbi:MAG TPA: GAF domain-containing protein [Kofleriaceae bacterium]|jgi:PAS domain S-box-containing protein